MLGLEGGKERRNEVRIIIMEKQKKGYKKKVTAQPRGYFAVWWLTNIKQKKYRSENMKNKPGQTLSALVKIE